MQEIWKDAPGFEGRYQVSNTGRVKSVSFMQPYVLRNGKPALRATKEKIVAQQLQNSGYFLVHLHKDNARKAKLVHRLVAEAFIGANSGEVNHKNGIKTDNRVDNLEWVTSSENKEHAVGAGLNRQACRVVCPRTGTVYASISSAAKHARMSPRTISARWGRT